MNKFSVHELELGKYFSNFVYLDDNYVLLSPETPVNEALIKLLETWDIPHVLSEGKQAEDRMSHITEGREGETDNLNVRLKERANLMSAWEYFEDLLKFTEEIYRNYKQNEVIIYEVVNQKIKDFVLHVKELRTSMLRFFEFPVYPNYLIEHSLRSTVVGIIFCLHMHWPPHKTIDIGIICLLHKIGMTRIPEQLYMSEKLLGEQERRLLSTHPILGYKALHKSRFSTPVCTAVLESHENIDGSGYPQSLKDAQISEYGRMIAIISEYIAMTSSRPFRVAKDGYHAAVDMIQQRGRLYDAQLLGQFFKLVTVYPIGSFVRVENGSEGVVIQTFPNRAKHPLIRVIRGPHGEIYRESPLIDTSEETYNIVAIIPPTKCEYLKEHLKF